MPSEYTALPPEFLQAHPALSLMRLAALSAGPDGMLDDDTLELMFEQVETGAMTLIAPSDVWPTKRLPPTVLELPVFAGLRQ